MHDLTKSELEARKISQSLYDQMERKKYREQTEKKLGEFALKYGRDSSRIIALRNKGKEDRIKLITLDENTYDDQIDRNIYRAGFVENGNLILLGNLDKLTPKQLEEYGKNDFISGILPEEIPSQLKENVSYSQGYLMASILNDSSKKGRK